MFLYWTYDLSLYAVAQGTSQLVTQSTRRITDFSYPRPFIPKNERSLWRTFVPLELSGNESSRNFRSRDLSFAGTFVPGPFRSREFSFPENESSWELTFLGPFVPWNFCSHYPIGLVTPLLCVLNYCMFGCDFTLMMLTPLWTSELTLYVGRPAFATHLSVFDVPVTVSLHTKRLR